MSLSRRTWLGRPDRTVGQIILGFIEKPRVAARRVHQDLPPVGIHILEHERVITVQLPWLRNLADTVLLLDGPQDLVGGPNFFLCADVESVVIEYVHFFGLVRVHHYICVVTAMPDGQRMRQVLDNFQAKNLLVEPSRNLKIPGFSVPCDKKSILSSGALVDFLVMIFAIRLLLSFLLNHRAQGSRRGPAAEQRERINLAIGLKRQI